MAMETLRRLVEIGSFQTLHDKLVNWLRDYDVCGTSQNFTRCTEIVQLHERVREQLDKLMSQLGLESGKSASDLSLYRYPWHRRSYMDYPYLGGYYPYSGRYGYYGYGRLHDWQGYGYYSSMLAENAQKDRKIADLTDSYERDIKELQDSLEVTDKENRDLQAELNDTKDELATVERQSSSDKMFNEAELSDLRHKLRVADDELARMKRRYTDLEDEFMFVTGRHPRTTIYRSEYLPLNYSHDDSLLSYSARAPLPLSARPYSPTLAGRSARSISRTTARSRPSRARSHSPSRVHSGHSSPARSLVTNTGSEPEFRARRDQLISKFNDLFSVGRLDAMRILRVYSSDHENNQRIVFSTVREAFSAAKSAFYDYRARIRSQMAVSHSGPGSLETAVQQRVEQSSEPVDTISMSRAVMAALNRNARIYLQPSVSYNVIHSFISDMCRLAWQMQALRSPLDIAFAADGELFDEFKYRRSYDSDFTAPLVNHHVWPCLMQGAQVVIKGEAVTRRGASLTGGLTSARSRPTSPSLPLASGRSRSPSPRRTDRSSSKLK